MPKPHQLTYGSCQERKARKGDAFLKRGEHMQQNIDKIAYTSITNNKYEANEFFINKTHKNTHKMSYTLPFSHKELKRQNQ